MCDETRHTSHHPDAVIIDITKNGLVPDVGAPRSYVSDTPIYNKLLTGHDIGAVFVDIKSSPFNQCRVTPARFDASRLAATVFE